MWLKQLNNFMLTLENKPKIKSKHYSHKTPRLKKPKRNKQNPSLKLWGEESNKWKTKLKLSHNCYTIDGTCKSEGLVSSEKKSNQNWSPQSGDWVLIIWCFIVHIFSCTHQPVSCPPCSPYTHTISHQFVWRDAMRGHTKSTSSEISDIVQTNLSMVNIYWPFPNILLGHQKPSLITIALNWKEV